MMTVELKAQARGVYKGPLFPNLHDEQAGLCRYQGDWVAAHFLTKGVFIRPTGEAFHVDASTCWILLHKDDFDIETGGLGPCDWCSSFDFQCTGLCKDQPLMELLRKESRRDGSIITPVADPLRELARLIGQRDPFSPYREDFRPDETQEGRQIVEHLRKQAQFGQGTMPESPLYERGFRDGQTFGSAISLNGWHVLIALAVGAALGWGGSVLWQWLS